MLTGLWVLILKATGAKIEENRTKNKLFWAGMERGLISGNCRDLSAKGTQLTAGWPRLLTGRTRGRTWLARCTTWHGRALTRRCGPSPRSAVDWLHTKGVRAYCGRPYESDGAGVIGTTSGGCTVPTASPPWPVVSHAPWQTLVWHSRPPWVKLSTQTRSVRSCGLNGAQI